MNEAYVIGIKSGLDEYYLGHNDVVVSKVRAAVLYGDEMWANSELDRVIKTFRNTECAFLNEKNIYILPVEIKIKK